MDDKPSPRLLDLMAMGLGSALMVGLGLLFGVLADDRFHSSPWGVLVGLVFGLIAAIGSTVRQMRKYL